jgi:hypothetical protein
MRRGGFYSSHSRPQQGAGSYGFTMLEEAARTVPLPDDGGQGVVVADMGAAQGRSELEPLGIVVRELRARLGEGPPVAVVHTDLPGNDFTALFELVETAPDSYLHAASGVFPYAAGRSFFGPLFPEQTLTLGWSAIAVHWLSEVPCPLPDHVYSSFATGEQAEAFAARSAADWHRFLAHRAAELVPGGQVVIVGGAAEPGGISGAEPLMGTAEDVARDMVGEGLLSRDELAVMTVPTWNRTPGDFAAPFQDRSLDLELLEDEVHVLPDLFAAAYASSGDAEVLADGVTSFVRAFTEPSLFGEVLASRAPDERAALANEFYGRVHDLIRSEPDRGRALWHVVTLRIRRR